MKLGFIGVGSMGGAIVRQIVNAGAHSSTDLYLASKSGESALRVAQELGASATNVATAAASDVVILAVKPHVICSIDSSIPPTSLIISVAAGVGIETIEAATSARVIRAMPNIGATIAESMTALAAGERATTADLEIAKKLFAAVGKVEVIDESLFPAFTAIASCSLAWTCSYIDGLARGALAQGMPKQQAVRAAAAAVKAAAELVLQAPETKLSGVTSQTALVTPPALLIDRVTSPGGSTIAGLIAAEEAGLSRAAVNAVRAACARDAELS